MKWQTNFIFILIIIWGKISFAQKPDSLLNVLENSSNYCSPPCLIDTFRYKILVEISDFYYRSNHDSAYVYLQKSLILSETLKFPYNYLAKANSVNKIGWLYLTKGEGDSAFVFFDRALHEIDLLFKKKDEKSLKKVIKKTDLLKASIYSNKGVGYKDRSDYTSSLEYYYKALNIYDNYNYKSGLANIYGSIGIVHKNMSNLSKALEFYFKALAIDKGDNNKRGISRHYGNLAIVYRNLKQYDSALICLNSAIEINNEMNDLLGIANNYISMGQIYTSLEEYPLAEKYYQKALEINKKFNRKKGITANYANLGFMYSKMGKYELAEKYLKMAETINRELSMREYLKETCSGLHKVYEKTGRSNLALKYFKEYIQIRDSIVNEEQRKFSIMKEIQFEYDKKATADSIANAKQIEIKNAELAKNKAEIRAKKQQQVALYGGLIIVILFAGIMYNRFKISNAQKAIIEKQKILAEEQKLLLSEKNKEITDSINYAKRIQSAITPPSSFIQSIFPNSFVLYLPKDIVAGDFYWLEKTNDCVYIAAADCTGHGVPGALMSVVCNNALNRSIREFKLRETGEILDKTREIVISEFQKGNEDLKDGMDISLSSFQFNKTNQNVIMKWSGANNPLWIIHKNENNEKVLNKILPTKQSIGKTDNAIPFTTQTISLSAGDLVYLFTDGYRDQFGGLHIDSKKPGGKKLKSGRFKQLLLSISDLSLELQKKELVSFLQKWKGEMEQIDDICIIGIRV